MTSTSARVLLACCLFCLAAGGFAQSIPRIDGARAMDHLRKQVAFGPRVPGTASHERTRTYLVDTLRQFASKVSVQSFRHGDVAMSNVVASFGTGSEPGLLLCAHWDTRPFADQEKDPARAKRPIPGANDGASGVAVLLEIARSLHDVPPPVPVAIVLFDGEDWGKTSDEMFLGSKHYAKNPLPWKPRRGILLDMVGDADLSIPVEIHSWDAAAEMVRAVWDVAESMGVKEFRREAGGAILDDHVPLIAAGIPTINLIDFDYPHWHTLADTPDKCSADSLRKVGDVVLRYLHTQAIR
ncbi:M28 family peptidase [Candidatus Poribacteria bacterium]|nr:M28 family peptidase [Candidatus Poribacteria bacterium]